jgi:hypothetical protein
MGLFTDISSNRRKSEAAVIVAKLLKSFADAGLFDHSPAAIARKLVNQAWKARSEVYIGRFRQRPHPVTIAASALASGFDLFAEDDAGRTVLFAALGQTLSDAQRHGKTYRLGYADQKLFDEAMHVFAELQEDRSEMPRWDEVEKLVFRSSEE